VEIRPVRPDEHQALGDLTVAAYAAIDPEVVEEDGYAGELRDVAGRAAGGEVLVAVDDTGRLLGGVTYVAGPDSAWARVQRARRCRHPHAGGGPGGAGTGRR
jgi:hypothetical protein